MLQELIKEWREFLEWWSNNVKRDYFNGYLSIKTPTFYDFMQWLSDKYK